MVELQFIFSEIKQVLKPRVHFCSVRNENDNFYKKGIEIQDGVYDNDGFQIRFYTKDDIVFLTKEDFEILSIKEEHEEPVTLYVVHTRKYGNYEQYNCHYCWNSNLVIITNSQTAVTS